LISIHDFYQHRNHLTHLPTYWHPILTQRFEDSRFMKPLETWLIAHLQKPVVRKKAATEMLGKDWMWESSLITKEQKGFVILLTHSLTHSLTQELQKDSDIPETLSLLWFLFFEAFKQVAAQQSTNLWGYKKWL
jgi:hypothetical protein